MLEVEVSGPRPRFTHFIDRGQPIQEPAEAWIWYDILG